MENFAHKVKEALGLEENIVNLAPDGRFVLFKIGPVLAVNHGMGMGSTSIMLNEILKLVHYCELRKR